MKDLQFLANLVRIFISILHPMEFKLFTRFVTFRFLIAEVLMLNLCLLRNLVYCFLT